LTQENGIERIQLAGEVLMYRIGLLIWVATAIATSAFADQMTPMHTIAVAGEAELLMPPDHAKIELGAVSQASIVGDALADNSARMSRVIAAVKALGIPDKDIQTSQFVIQPKYAPMPDRSYDEQQFRTIVGYYISNKVTVTVKDIGKIAKVIDESVAAGANASGTVSFGVDDMSSHLDDARRRAIENAHHRAEVLTAAAHVSLGAALSIIDNRADTNYDDNVFETVVVTGGGRAPTPIEPGLVRLNSVVTVVYATR
jgi:uncharacterized protein